MTRKKSDPGMGSPNVDVDPFSPRVTGLRTRRAVGHGTVVNIRASPNWTAWAPLLVAKDLVAVITTTGS